MHFPNLLPAKRLEQGIVAIVRMKPGRNEGNPFHAMSFQQGKHNLKWLRDPSSKVKTTAPSGACCRPVRWSSSVSASMVT
jgi:hypothetical protein